MCGKIVSKDPFMLNYCPEKYKIHEMCDKAVDSCVLALKCVRDWFIMSKMIEKLDNAVFSNDYIDFGGLDSDFVIFFS